MDYIERFGSISSWEAYADLGVTQLGARIYELKQRGVEFTKERVSTKNRFGEATHFDRYMFKEAANG